eukprot:1172227-Prorocentrum_minimum.AAC.1
MCGRRETWRKAPLKAPSWSLERTFVAKGTETFGRGLRDARASREGLARVVKDLRTRARLTGVPRHMTCTDHLLERDQRLGGGQ